MEEKYKNMRSNDLRAHLILISGDIEQHKVLPFFGTLMSIAFGMCIALLPLVIKNDAIGAYVYQLLFVFVMASAIQLAMTVYLVMQVVSYNAIQKSVIKYELEYKLKLPTP